jgi:hypothetical protein
MDIREQLEAFWSGEKPDQIPYTVYHTKVADGNDPRAWAELFAKGLGLTYKWYPFKLETRDLVTDEKTWTEDGKQIRRVVQRTSVGEIWAEWVDNWQQKYWLETPADYRVMTYIVKNTTVVSDLEDFCARVDALPPHAVAWAMIGRTPLQEILVDYVGLEKFSLHLFDYEAEVRELYAALLTNFRQKVAIAAPSPSKFISNLENFTAETLGPKRYAEFLLPVYEECFPILHAAGKIIGTHYDGRTKSCRDLIARAPIDLIESLTIPPEGDQTLAECRAVWRDKLFWCNVNVSAYELPRAELRELLTMLVTQGAPDGRRLAFEISEALPANWKASIPIVLDMLRELRR